MIPVKDKQAFAAATRTKLVLEIAGKAPSGHDAFGAIRSKAASVEPALTAKPGVSCTMQHFRAKWAATRLRVKKMHQNKNIEPRSDSIGTEKALGKTLLEQRFGN
jgi:hypothetical protein